MKKKVQINDHNIYERKHSGNVLLFAFIGTSNCQPFKITSQEQKTFKMFFDELCVLNMKKVPTKVE